MSLLTALENLASTHRARIAIGVGRNPGDIINSARAASGFAEVVLVGDRDVIREYALDTSGLEIIHTEHPHTLLVELLASGRVDGVVRGNLESRATLGELKRQFNLERLYRVALLQSAEGEPFFFAPVGIDEAGTLSDRLTLTLRGCEFIQRFGIIPRVGVLSGGRMGDVGRSPQVDRSLAEGEFITSWLRRQGIDAEHYTVLVEDAARHANFIIAPDGITGNLMYRTLVLLGGGDGFGAPVLMDRVFVDSSRAKGDYTKPIMMASALAKK